MLSIIGSQWLLRESLPLLALHLRIDFAQLLRLGASCHDIVAGKLNNSFPRSEAELYTAAYQHDLTNNLTRCGVLSGRQERLLRRDGRAAVSIPIGVFWSMRYRLGYI